MRNSVRMVRVGCWADRISFPPYYFSCHVKSWMPCGVSNVSLIVAFSAGPHPLHVYPCSIPRSWETGSIALRQTPRQEMRCVFSGRFQNFSVSSNFQYLFFALMFPKANLKLLVTLHFQYFLILKNILKKYLKFSRLIGLGKSCLF